MGGAVSMADFFAGRVRFPAGENRLQIVQGVAFPQAVQPGCFVPAGGFEPDRFAAPGHLAAHTGKQLQQPVQIGGLLLQRPVNHHAELLPVGGLGLVPQPLVVAFPTKFRVRYDGQSVFDADGVIQPPHDAGAAPKISELPVTGQVDRRPDDMIVDVGPVDVGADHKGVIPLGKPFGKFHAQAVGFLRGDLAGLEGLTHLIGDYIVRAPHPPGGGDILALCQQKFRVGGPAVTGIAGDEPAAVRLLRIGRIVDDVADGPALCAALADVQRDDTGGGHGGNLLLIFTGIDILSESAYNNKYKAGNGVCLSKR